MACRGGGCTQPFLSKFLGKGDGAFMEIAFAIWQAVAETYAAFAADLSFVLAVVEALLLSWQHSIKK
jgi:hypothetical protein